MCSDADRVPDGAIAGNEENKAESRAKLRKGAAGEEAGQRTKTDQEVKGAERERDRQRRKKKGGRRATQGTR